MNNWPHGKVKEGKKRRKEGIQGKGHSVESNLSGNYINTYKIPYYDSKIVSHAFFT